MATYAFAIAVERGLERGCCELIREAARLHDVGRLYLDPSLAQRPTEALSAAELSEAERSRAAGAKLAWGAGVPERACEWVAAASERYDGSGPAGKRGEEIPLAGRITRVACAYVEVVERTAAAPPMVRDEPRALALSELRGAAGTTLDGQVVEAMAAIIARAAPTPA